MMGDISPECNDRDVQAHLYGMEVWKEVYWPGDYTDPQRLNGISDALVKDIIRSFDLTVEAAAITAHSSLQDVQDLKEL